jgi:hypothetical protein
VGAVNMMWQYLEEGKKNLDALAFNLYILVTNSCDARDSLIKITYIYFS